MRENQTTSFVVREMDSKITASLTSVCISWRGLTCIKERDTTGQLRIMRRIIYSARAVLLTAEQVLVGRPPYMHAYVGYISCLGSKTSTF